MKTYRLDELCSVIVDCEHKTAPIDAEGDHFAVGTPAMRNHQIDYTQARRISRATFESWTRRLAPLPGDLLLAREAPVGPVVRIPTANNVAPGQRTVLMRPNAELTDSRYLHFLLGSPAQQAALQVKSAGSTVHHLNVPDIRSLSLNVPSLPEQQAIAEVLGALDDKIAANTALISTADQLVTAAYRARSDTAASTNLGAIAEFQNRRRVPLSASERESRAGSIPYYGANGPMGVVDVPIFDEPLVLMGEDGSVARDDGTPFIHYVWGPLWVNNHAHVLTGTGISTELLAVILRQSDVSALVTGAVQPKLSMGQARRLEISLPNASDLVKLEILVAASFASVRAATEENRTLAATRDALLPQLMSGKLRVRDAEAAASAAGA